MILTNSGVLKLMQRIKSFITAQLNTKAPSVHTHSISEIENLSSQLGGGYTKSEVDTLLTGKADSSHTHTSSDVTDLPNEFVGVSNNQTISGSKTFTNYTYINGYRIVIRSTDQELGVIPSSNRWNGFTFCDKNKNETLELAYGHVKTGITKIDYNVTNNTPDKHQLTFDTIELDQNNNVTRKLKSTTVPTDDNLYSLGSSSNRWSEVYSATSSINTSDSRLKNTITDIDDSLLDAWESIQPKQYKFNDATETKGKQARFHTGYIAQDIEKACTDNNIDATRYGLFCYDSWEEEPEITEDVEVEKDGVKTTEKRIIRPKQEKGDSYSLRYEEALVVECAYLRREINRLKEELNQLKTK